MKFMLKLPLLSGLSLMFAGSLFSAPEPAGETEMRMELTEQAFGGDPEAMAILARYYHMRGAHREAELWYVKAGELGHLASLKELAYLVLSGKLGQRDDERAVKIYRELIEFGDPQAHALLGDLYGVEYRPLYNPAQALVHYRDGAVAGDPPAMLKLARIYRHGSEGRANYEMAFMWYKRCSDMGMTEAQFELALCLQYGLGTAVDTKAAFELHRKSSDNGNAEASFVLAEAYYEGRELTRDTKLAREYYEMASDKGHAQARQRLEQRSF